MKSFSFVFTVLICGLLLSSVAFAKKEVENSTKKYGGQCVSYVRTLLGGDRTKMPGLCKFAKGLCCISNMGLLDFGYGKGEKFQSLILSWFSPHIAAINMDIAQLSLRSNLTRAKQY